MLEDNNLDTGKLLPINAISELTIQANRTQPKLTILCHLINISALNFFLGTMLIVIFACRLLEIRLTWSEICTSYPVTISTYIFIYKAQYLTQDIPLVVMLY